MSTDKVTRVLIMYQRLLHGNKIDKQMFMFEHDIDRRSFERDIDDIRLFLSENYTGSELLYDREERVYYMTNLTVSRMHLPEAFAIAKMISNSSAFRRDEVYGMLNALISALSPSEAKVLERECSEELKIYREPEHNQSCP